MTGAVGGSSHLPNLLLSSAAHNRPQSSRSGQPTLPRQGPDPSILARIARWCTARIPRRVARAVVDLERAGHSRPHERNGRGGHPNGYGQLGAGPELHVDEERDRAARAREAGQHMDIPGE
jgi:hypothetical protein